MPAYHQIEVYFSLSAGLESVKQRFAAACRDLGWDFLLMDAWIHRLTWTVQNDGWVDTNDWGCPPLLLSIGSLDFPVSCVRYGWILPQLDVACLAWDILIESALIEISTPPTWAYRPGVIPAIWTIMQQIMSRARPEYGIFWTNEVQDGQAWRALVEGGHRDRWQFDLAIVPTAFWSPMASLHPAFVTHRHGPDQWIAARRVGSELSWIEDGPA
jgi:hypothetical protein